MSALPPAGLNRLRGVLASDFDGTLADNGRVLPAVWSALRDLQQAGWAVVLITGRTREDLDGLRLPLDRFDRLVLDNGCVLLDPATNTSHILGSFVMGPLLDALQEASVPAVAYGHMIVASDPHEPAIRAVLAQHPAPAHLERNGRWLMVLPQGVDKASGLAAALDHLHIPPARAIAVGDSENDLALFRAARFSAAVANAVPAVRAASTWQLTQPAGRGVVELVQRILANHLREDFWLAPHPEPR
jgi:hydroxymethylpyrimidine pyrophosphatase-like HAD family hydrolase